MPLTTQRLAITLLFFSIALTFFSSCKNDVKKDPNDVTGPRLTLGFKTEEVTEFSEIDDYLNVAIKDGEPDVTLVALPSGDVIVLASAIDTGSGIKSFKLEFDPPQQISTNFDTTIASTSDSAFAKVLLAGNVSPRIGETFKVRAIATNHNDITSETGWVKWDVLTEEGKKLVYKLDKDIVLDSLNIKSTETHSSLYDINFNYKTPSDSNFSADISINNPNKDVELRISLSTPIGDAAAVNGRKQPEFMVWLDNNSSPFPWWNVDVANKPEITWEYGWAFLDTSILDTINKKPSIEKIITLESNQNNSDNLVKVVSKRRDTMFECDDRNTSTFKMVQIWRRTRVTSDFKTQRYFYTNYHFKHSLKYRCDRSPNILELASAIIWCGKTPCK